MGFEFIARAGARFCLSQNEPERYDYGTVFITLALLVLVVLCGIALVAAAVVVIHGTVSKNKFGVNLNPAECPRCRAAMPSIRVPKSFRQTLWGGWSCPRCGCEVDKWGREV